MSNSVDQASINTELQLNTSLLGFIQYIRERHFNIGIQGAIDSQVLAERIGILNKRFLKRGLKALLCQSSHDWERFDDLFDNYWFTTARQQHAVSTVGGRAPRSPKVANSGESNGGEFDVADPTALEGVDAEQPAADKASHASASTQSNLSNSAFNQLDNAAELRRVEEICEQLARRIRKRLLRRFHRANRGRHIDMRRTLRSSLSTGGVPVNLVRQSRKKDTPKLVLLLDVSRSMSVYSYLFLRFARGILGAFKQSDAFAFHTNLVHIGDTLREANRRKLAEKMAVVSTGFGGGTRMDESLALFNRNYASKVLGKKSTVVIVSDGYDTGKPEELAKQLQRIKKRARKLVWLNPLLGQASYEPTTGSMQAALPLLDVFAPAHNLESLAALEKHLRR